MEKEKMKKNIVSTKKSVIAKKPKQNGEKKVVQKKSVKRETSVAKTEKVVASSKKNKIKYRTDEQKEMLQFLTVILVVVVCCGAIYLCTRAFITKDLFKKDEPKREETIPGVIDYNVATIGTMLNGPYDEYYVVIYDAVKGDYISDMSSLVTQYKSQEKAKHVYTVDLSNVLNSSYYDPENASTSVTSLQDLKVGDITLIKVKKGVINKLITDYTKMQSELGIAK